MAVSTRCLTDHHGPLIAPQVFATLAKTLEGDALEEAKKQAIVELAELQQDNWISVVTDGELNRIGSSSIDAISEAKYLKSQTDLLVKIRLPRFSESVMADKASIVSLLDLGVGYIQLDGAAYAPLIHKAEREFIKSQGGDPDRLLAEMLEADNEVLKSIILPNEDIKIAVCFHDISDLNGEDFADDLDKESAEKLLNELAIKRFIFDCGVSDQPDFSFLTLLPEDCEVVLCLLDGNVEDIADPDDILDKILQASKIIDTDRFALATRHGFYAREDMTPKAAWEHQEEVLTILMDAASRAWGIDF